MNPIYDVATVVLSAASTALTGASKGSPRLAYISGLEDPPGNCCGPEDAVDLPEDEMGELVVWTSSAFQYATFPAATQQATRCAQPWATNVSVRLLRCGVLPDDHGVIDPDDLQAQARWMMEDRWFLTRVVCTLLADDWQVAVTSLGPAGDDACPGNLLQLVVALRPTYVVSP